MLTQNCLGFQPLTSPVYECLKLTSSAIIKDDRWHRVNFFSCVDTWDLDGDA
jgi:hypothetical protein